MNVGSLGKSIAKVDFWTTHDAPWSHGPQITDAGSSPPRVRVEVVEGLYNRTDWCYAQRFADVSRHYADVSRTFRERFARFTRGITHVLRTFREHFTGVTRCESVSHTGRP